MTDNLQSYSEDISGLPLFLAAAEEGGSASVLGNNDNLDEYYENSYSDDDSDYSSSSANSVHSGATSMSEIGRKDDSTNAYEAGKSIGSLMSAYGLNLDLAPLRMFYPATVPASAIVHLALMPRQFPIWHWRL